jgi:type IV fimbrial biogenesis protein FimT
MKRPAARPIRSGRRPRSAGFTLLELMTTLSVVGIVLAVGVPSYLSVVRNNRAATNANELVSALTIARSEAVRRGDRVSLCRSNDGASCGGTWTDGWIVFVDGAANDTAAPVVSQVLQTWPAPDGEASVVTRSNGSDVDVTWVRFLPRGDTRTTEPLPLIYNIQIDNCTGNVARNIEINAVGRTSVTKVACS